MSESRAHGGVIKGYVTTRRLLIPLMAGRGRCCGRPVDHRPITRVRAWALHDDSLLARDKSSLYLTLCVALPRFAPKSRRRHLLPRGACQGRLMENFLKRGEVLL